jgi:UDP-N-acetylmuramoyl-L-alanyl-D-glutamate--2,6-diaminopimelate ligase
VTIHKKYLTDLGLAARGGCNPLISGLAIDSRRVGPSELFAALPGTAVHGSRFIKMALERGATAILTDAEGAAFAEDVLSQSQVAIVVTEEPRAALSAAAALWFARQPDTMVAVTGTNGKTSVASFTRQIWQALGYASVNLGTTGVEGDWQAPLAHTTPDPLTLHKALMNAADAGITHAAMEASSHGLDQRRLDGVALKAAAFTNFSQDHLDYHRTFDAYFAAKAGLFDRLLPPEGCAVINLSDPKGGSLADITCQRGARVLGVGPGGVLTILGQRYDVTGQDLRFAHRNAVHQVRLNLMGGFQAENVLIAAGLTIAVGADPADVFDALPKIETVKGRMQLVAQRDNGAAVFVDYAHTPDAVATALSALRPHVLGRLIAIIGAGGDRDATKRPLMGQAAAQAADLVFVTDDNPRSEDPAVIRAAVLGGVPGAIEVADRAEAILRATAELGPGDALLICGKGHETGQQIGNVTYPFDDTEQASISVAALDGKIP